MPPKRPEEPLISLEWAKSLIGLSLKVPQNWWVDCTGHKLHDVSQKWILLLDARNNDDLYLIAYDAVYEYADETSSTFHKYQLTYQAVWIGGGEIDIAEGIWYTKTTLDEWNQVIVEDGEDGGGRTID